MKKYAEMKKKEDLFEGIMTRMEILEDHKIYVKTIEHIAEWVPEGTGIPGFDGENDYQKYPVARHKLTALVKYSNDFVYSPSFDLESNILQTMATAMSRAEESAFINGDGVDKPYGLLHAGKGAELGVTASMLAYDDVIKLYFSVKAKYRKNGKWLMNDQTAFKLRTLKDSNGNYLWNQVDNTILGKEVLISEFMPSETSPILFGDFRYYRIIDRCKFSMQELKELFAREDSMGYLGHVFIDGMLTNKDAVKKFQLSVA